MSATGTATFVTPVRLRRGSVYTLLVLQAADGSGALRVRALVDAIGSVRTPVAGPDTGYGGTAGTGSAQPHPHGIPHRIPHRIPH